MGLHSQSFSWGVFSLKRALCQWEDSLEEGMGVQSWRCLLPQGEPESDTIMSHDVRMSPSTRVVGQRKNSVRVSG